MTYLTIIYCSRSLPIRNLYKQRKRLQKNKVLFTTQPSPPTYHDHLTAEPPVWIINSRLWAKTVFKLAVKFRPTYLHSNVIFHLNELTSFLFSLSVEGVHEEWGVGSQNISNWKINRVPGLDEFNHSYRLLLIKIF